MESGISHTGEFLERARRQDPQLGIVLKLARNLSAPLSRDKVLQSIMGGVTELLDCERATLMLPRSEDARLWSAVTQGGDTVPIELRRGEGIAGWVLDTGRDLNIRDVYQDARFDPSWDQRNGYRTRSMLCQVLREAEGNVIGVAQAINKRDGYFTVDDENMMRTVLAMASISIVNTTLTTGLWKSNYELKEASRELQERVREIDLLYRLEREVREATSVEEATDQILREVRSALPCKVVQIALFTPAGGVVTHRLWHDGRVVERSVADSRVGFAGALDRDELGHNVCGGAEATDARLAEEERLGFVPTTGLTVPLEDGGERLGALGLYGRAEGMGCFDDADAKLISVVAATIARLVARLQRREQSAREERLASLGKALSMVLHDFRTPMTIASGYVEMLAASEDPQMRQRLAHTILRQLDRVVQMSKEVLEFSRGTREMLVQKVLLAEFAAEAQELIQQVFAATDVSIRVEAHERGTARLDSFKLLRVVQNLARNARDAMASAHGGRARGNFSLTIAAEGEEVVFTFADDGPGIPAAFRPQMFQAFATHGKADGTGLGLAMVRQFAVDHGGSASFHDTPGGGATFVVRLPRQGPAAPPAAAAGAAAAP